ncbi:MAG TPA: AmmeMemoRadiSam system protein A [Pilimelia sp.]|nr:AmmeMemoRadiSam system protein A [Pilimelia sp.]
MSEPAGSDAVPDADGSVLARRAAEAVAARLAQRPPDGRLPAAASLRAVGATFVTLERHGTLLGCIGTLDPARPRYLDAMRNAVRATADPRLPPVTAAQWPSVDVTVSALGRHERLPAETPDGLLAVLRPGVDGLVLAAGQRRATFLPVVWHKLPDPERFLAALLRKGGWATGGQPWRRAWPPALSAVRYTVAEFTDPAPRPAPGATPGAAG